MRKLFATVALALTISSPALAAPDFAPEVERALVAWTRQPAESLRPWARAIADVCTSREECIRFAAQAHVETRWVPWAVDQSCNDPSWRASRRGWERRACDAGKAFGPWQVQDERFRGASPEFQATVALQLMRAHPELWTTSRAAKSHAEWWLRQR